MNVAARSTVRALAALALLALVAVLSPSWADARSQARIAEAVEAGDKRYALLVGVGDYERTVPVRFVDENLDAVETVMREVFFVPEANIRRVVDPSAIDLFDTFGFEPGSPGTFGGLDIAEPDAELFVYFIGHGSRDLRQNADAAASEGFLLARNSRPGALRRTAYSYDTLIANLDAFKQRVFPEGRVVLFLESCFSGETNDGPINPTLGPMIAPVTGWEPPEESHDVVAIAAAGADTPAYWDEERRLGLFTDALVTGLKGRADDGDGTLTLEELGAFLADRVPARARARDLGKSSQRPQLNENAAGTLVSLFRAPVPGPSGGDALLIEFEVDDLEYRLSELDEKDLPALAALRDDVRAFMEECGDACRPQLARLLIMRDELELKVRRCEAASVMTGRHLDRGAFDRIAQFDAICAPEETVAACVASADTESIACRCLADPLDEACREDPLAHCTDALAEAREAALAGPSLAPLERFESDFPTCAGRDRTVLADARAAVCAAGEDTVSGDEVPPGLAACPFAETIAAAAEERKTCAAEFAAIRAAPRDHARLARFLRENPSCPERPAAQDLRDARLASAMDAAARADTPVARKRARDDLSALRVAFDDSLTSAARSSIDDALAALDRTPCSVALRNAEMRGTDALERFIAGRPDCRSEVEEARGAIVRASCAADFERIDSQDAAALFDFVDERGECADEVREARARTELLATQCIHRAGGLEASRPQEAIRAYRECDATFGLAFDWVGEEASDAIGRLQRAAFCRDGLREVRGDEAGLERFIARRSADCPAEAVEARRLLAALTPPSPDGIYDGVRGYTDSGRPSPSRACLGRYDFVATVRNGAIVFESDGRRWIGRVSDDGSLTLGRSDITPPPRTETWITARIENGRAEGSLFNGYCGNGYFRLTKR